MTNLMIFFHIYPSLSDIEKINNYNIKEILLKERKDIVYVHDIL